VLEREGLQDDPEWVSLGREIRSGGRSVSRVNGRTVNLSILREIGEVLVDVHGQSEHLSLLRVGEHLSLLDRFAHDEGLRREYEEVYRALTDIRRELADLRRREADAARQADLLAYQINEIEAARLRAGEEATLLEERTRLANAEQLATLADRVVAALDEAADERPPASERLGEAADALAALARIDASMASTHAEGQALLEQMADLAKRLRDYREAIEFSPRRLDEVEERLGLIRNLERKYGGAIEAVLAHAESARRDLEGITHAEERLRALQGAEEDALKRLGETGERLTHARQQAAERLATGIEGELGDLRMAGARFKVDQRCGEDPTGAPVGDRRLAFDVTGLDQVEFLVAPNPGEGLKPLAKTASGGETSRLMLGLKSVLVKADRTPTLIFDEIDQGIGGRVGAVVGRKLWGLAREHQVLCVSHLPQLAAYGDQHFKVDKELRKGRTVTRAQELKGDERVGELAQMLGGAGASNLESAAALLRQAEEEKQASSSRDAQG
jgi:DNA repair protein RecN (Recombination protein N)